MSKSKTIGIILARSGSKRLPSKNVQVLGSRTLLEWAIAAARDSNVIDEIYVSTDSPLYAAIASKQANVKVIDRPAELATDDATSESGIAHALQVLAEKNVKPDVGVLLQATSPLTRPETVREVVKSVTEKGFDTAISVVRAKKRPQWFLEKVGDSFVPIIVLPPDSPYSTENPPPMYLPSGGAYAFRVDFFQVTQRIYGGRMNGVEVSEIEGIDVDSIMDLNFARYALTLLKNAVTEPEIKVEE